MYGSWRREMNGSVRRAGCGLVSSLGRRLEGGESRAELVTGLAASGLRKDEGRRSQGS